MRSKASANFWRETRSISCDGFLRIADGIEQILPLHAEELLALRSFLKLLHGLRVHRTQRLDARAHFFIKALGVGDGFGVGNGFVAGGQFFNRAIQFLAAGLVEIFQLGLAADQIDFDLRAIGVGLLHHDAQQLQFVFGGGERFAHAGFFGGQLD